MWIKHQPDDYLSLPETTGTDQTPIKVEIPVFCTTASIPTEKKTKSYVYTKLRPIYRKRSIGFPAVHAIARLTDTKHDKRPIIEQEIIQKQENDSYYLQASFTVGLSGSTFYYDKNGFLVRAASIDVAVHKVVPTSLQPGPLCHLQYSTLAWHPGERLILDSMAGAYYCLRMANDIYKIVRDCHECAWNKPSDKRWRLLQSFWWVVRCSFLPWTTWHNFWRR